MSASTSCDVLICGAGPVGSALALALTQAGWHCRLLDAAPAPIQGDDRSLGLTTGSVAFLQRLGVWAAVRGAQPIRKLHISERGRFGRSLVEAAEHGLDALGAVVPAQSLHDALGQQLQQAGISVERGCTLVDSAIVGGRPQPDGPEAASPVCLADTVTPAESVRRRVVLQQADGSEHVLETRLLVGADGLQSRVRALLGIAVREEDYGQLALVSQMQVGKDPAGCAYERFAPDGPLAVLPRGPRRVGVVWMLPQARATELADGPPEVFTAALQEAFGWRLGRMTLAAPILRWPLRRVRAERLTGPRGLLIGNAAAGFHPIAAQGFNLALRDAAALCGLLAGHADPGDSALLLQVEEQRRADHLGIERMTDGLVKLYTQQLPLIRQWRSLGLFGLDLLTPMQQGLVQRSAGLRAS